MRIVKTGWRIVYIKNRCLLNISDNCLLITESETVSLPLFQLSVVIIESELTTLSPKVINALLENNVCVIFCDKKHNPCFEAIGLYSTESITKRLKEQISWSPSGKGIMWQKIVKQKISMQLKLINRFNIDNNCNFESIMTSVEEDDKTNREALASRIYFKKLFGYSFNRRTENDTNSALNYGYALILSTFNRCISAYGFNNQISIHHCNLKNNFNLACDLMEPFRPFVDKVVLENVTQPFDFEYKKELINMLNTKVVYGNSYFKLIDAIEKFTYDILTNVNNTDYILRELDFE